MISKPENIAEFPVAVRDASAPVIDWWVHHWMGAANPVVRMQVAWMETLFDAMQMEAELLIACATSQQEIIKCLSDQQTLKDPSVLGSCYQDAIEDFVNAHLNRMNRVNEMALDFRQRVWEEI